jgi:membrane peptidoglycan carboxypeptidase
MPVIAHIVRRRRNRKDRRQTDRARKRLWLLLVIGILLLAVIIPAGITTGQLAWVYWTAAQALPTVATTTYLDPIIGPTTLVDRAGQTLLYSVQDPLGDRRTWLPYASLPSSVVLATLHMEDTNYLDVTQFDAAGTLNRLGRYMLGNPAPRDTSLTGRLVDRILMPYARRSDLDEMLLHIVLTAEVNRLYTPEQVLEWYLNTAYYGHDAYGIEAAAQVYLGKPASELTYDDAALLAAIPPAPIYNPFDNETAARGRQSDLLRQMHGLGAISKPDFDTAIARYTPLRTDLAQPPRLAPEFALYARQQAEDILLDRGLDGTRLISRGGLRITTTLDVDLYYQAECLLRAHFAQLRGENPTTLPALTGEPCAAVAYLPSVNNVNSAVLPDTGAILLLDVASGEIRAMLGAVTAAQHQPGAMLYPFVYTQGFLSGDFTPATMLLDIPQPFPGPVEGLIYTPANPDGLFRGPINLRDAFAAGLRPPAVIVADTQGMNRILSVAHRIGLNSMDENIVDLSLLERGGAASVLDLTYAYAVFGTGGYMPGMDVAPVARNFRTRNPVAILKIEDAAGKVLWEYNETERALSRTPILQNNIAYLINNILADNTRRRALLNVNDDVLTIGRTVAVNNGITGDNVDSWTIGYTPQLIVGVHVGRSDDVPMTLDALNFQGSAPIWNALMQYAHVRAALPAAEWERPSEIAEYIVCEKSGMTPPQESKCPIRRELFLREVPPFLTDTYWQSVKVNSQTGQRATTNTPPNLVVENVYFIPPTVALDWWRSNGLPLPPENYDILSRPEVLKAVEIFLPQDYDYVGGIVDIRGGIENENIQSFQLAYGQGLNPTQWFEIGEPLTSFDVGSSMGAWNTTGLDGIYTLQLAVTYQDNSRDTDFVQVTVDNQPPVVQIQAGDAGQIFRFPVDTAIPVLALVTDNLAIQRVEFYHNGLLFGVDDSWPYGFEYRIERTGLEVFKAVAYDQVGNQTDAEIQVEVVREGG